MSQTRTDAVKPTFETAGLEDGILELSIVGTEFELGQFEGAGNLPVRLEGIVFYRGGEKDGRLAGKYEEVLKPILDPVHGFVGTEGRSVFTFLQRDGEGEPIGTITSENRSRIVGMQDGAMLVESAGTIVDGSRNYQNVVGRLASSSSIVLGEDFVLNVDLKLSYSIPKPHFNP